MCVVCRGFGALYTTVSCIYVRYYRSSFSPVIVGEPMQAAHTVKSISVFSILSTLFKIQTQNLYQKDIFHFQAYFNFVGAAVTADSNDGWKLLCCIFEALCNSHSISCEFFVEWKSSSITDTNCITFGSSRWPRKVQWSATYSIYCVLTNRHKFLREKLEKSTS